MCWAGIYVRPLTYVKYNHEGDWLFTCAKDHHPTVWNGETGERIGTYNGHNGAVWSCDVTRDTKRLVTASADMTMILWEAEGGQKLYQHSFDGPARYTEFSLGEREIMVTVDAFMGSDANIQVLTVSDDRNECTRPEREFQPRGRAAGGVVTTSSCVGLSTWEESWTSPAPVDMYRS